MIVAKDNSGDFATISEAVLATKSGDKIYAKPGVYNERVEIRVPDILIEGESPENTIIVSGYYARMKADDSEKLGTFRTYTMLANTNRFPCRNMTIANSAGFGRDVGQAVAVYAEGDGILFENCRILGHQDTLFTGPLPFKEIEKGGFRGPTEFSPRIAGRQLYRRCYIEGEVDFIFGSAHAAFDECELFSLNCGNEINGYVTAASTYNGDKCGYLFKNCRFTSDCPPKNGIYRQTVPELRKNNFAELRTWCAHQSVGISRLGQNGSARNGALRAARLLRRGLLPEQACAVCGYTYRRGSARQLSLFDEIVSAFQ